MQKYKQLNFKSGFTLLEILLVIGIIAILAGIVIVAINPGKQLAMARNTQRVSDVKQIKSAMDQYYIDTGRYPTTTINSLVEVCNTGTLPYPASDVECDDLLNLSVLVPKYITAIPVDPKATSTANGTGYKIVKDSTKKIVLTTPLAELGTDITIGNVPDTCTEFTYTAYSACSNNTKTRTLLTSGPAGCIDGTPVTSTSCSTHTISFDGNTNTGGSTASKTIEDNTSTTLTTNGFTKTGYAFSGWATSADGAVAYDDGDSYTLGSANVTLYAKWTVAADYCVTGVHTPSVAGNYVNNNTVVGGNPSYKNSVTNTYLFFRAGTDYGPNHWCITNNTGTSYTSPSMLMLTQNTILGTYVNYGSSNTDPVVVTAGACQ